MAEQATGDDLDLSVEQKSGSKKKLIIIIGAVLLVLIGGGAAATLFLTSDGGEAAGEGSEGQAAQGTDQDTAQQQAFYHDLRPPFVVSLEGRPKTLQVSMHVMTRDEDLVTFLEENDPLIRDRILSLLMEQEGKKLKTRAGKKKLQSKLEKEIGKIAKNQGMQGEVEALYFTSFVMQ